MNPSRHIGKDFSILEISMDFYLFFIYLFAGIVTFFASCAFILVPPFLGVIGRSIQSPGGVTDARFAILKSTIFYVLGFSLVFVLLGIGLGFVGKILLFQEAIQRIGGIVLIILGLVMIGVFKSSFFSKIYLSDYLVNCRVIKISTHFYWVEYSQSAGLPAPVHCLAVY